MLKVDSFYALLEEFDSGNIGKGWCGDSNRNGGVYLMVLFVCIYINCIILKILIPLS